MAQAFPKTNLPFQLKKMKLHLKSNNAPLHLSTQCTMFQPNMSIDATLNAQNDINPTNENANEAGTPEIQNHALLSSSPGHFGSWITGAPH